MPAKSRWLTKIQQIIEELAALNVPVIDRVICQRVFGVRRRRAVELMKFFGGYESANVMLLDRLGLIDRLNRIAAGDELAQEVRRKERLAAQLEEASRFRSASAVRIPVSPESLNRTMAALPAGVCFLAGKLEVQFASAEELLQRLFELAQGAANDFEGFCETVQAALPARPAADSVPSAGCSQATSSF